MKVDAAATLLFCSLVANRPGPSQRAVGSEFVALVQLAEVVCPAPPPVRVMVKNSTLLSVVRLCRLVLPEMQRRKWGRVVHLTSFVAKQPVPLLTVSSTLRAGLSALTKTLADQVGPDGVTVNVAGVKAYEPFGVWQARKTL